MHLRGGDTAGYLMGASEPAVQKLLLECLNPGDVFYDIGANVGYFSLLACKLVGDYGEVHCFEPLPENAAILRANLAANGFSNFTVHECALSDDSGNATLVVADLPGQAALARERAGGRALTVATVRLDDLELPLPTLVKIDVEGAEDRVLTGMRQTLARARPAIVVEIHADRREPVLALLRSAGYDSTDLDDAGGMQHVLAVAGRKTGA